MGSVGTRGWLYWLNVGIVVSKQGMFRYRHLEREIESRCSKGQFLALVKRDKVELTLVGMDLDAIP